MHVDTLQPTRAPPAQFCFLLTSTWIHPRWSCFIFKFRFSFSATQMLDLPDRRPLFVEFRALGPNFSFFPTTFDSKSSRFSQWCFNSTSSNLFARAVLPEDDRLGFVQEEPIVLQSYPNVSVFDWVAVVSILVPILSPVTSAIWELPFASCAITRSVDIVSRNIAAICAADAPCSVNTSLYPLSSLTLFVTSEHNSSLVLLEMFRKFRMLQAAEIQKRCKKNGSSVISGLLPTLAFLS